MLDVSEEETQNKAIERAIGKTGGKLIRGVLHPIETKNRLVEKGSEIATEKMVDVGKKIVRKKVTDDAERLAKKLNKGSKKAAQGVRSRAQHVEDQLQKGLKKAKRVGEEFTENMKLHTHREHRLKGANDIKGVKDIKSVTGIKKMDDVKHLSS